MVKYKWSGDDPEKPLTEKELRFVEAYINKPVIAQAARLAGISDRSTAAALLKKPSVRKMVERAQQARAKSLGLSEDRVIQELAQIALAPVNNQKLDAEGNPTIEVTSPTEVIISTVNGDKVIKTTTVKSVKMADKLSALKLLGVHMGMFKDQLEVTGKLSLEELITKSLIEETPSV